MNYDPIVKARASLVINEPFYATLILGMPLIETTQLPTAGTDGSNIYYNREFIERITHKQRLGVLIHETLHVVMKHSFRQGSRDHKLWNVAADYVINLLIKDGKFELPENILCDEKYRDMSTEQVYRYLLKNPDEQPKGQEDGSDMLGDIIPAPGNASQQAAAEAKAGVLINKAVAIGKAAGNLPSSLARQVEAHKADTSDWEKHLRRFMTEPRKDNQSWMRGQRRFMWQGLYLPTMFSMGLGEIAVILDSSGSVYSDASRFLSEIHSIGEDAHPKCITVLQVDAKVQHVHSYDPGEPILHEVKGGGGTDLTRGFDYIDDPKNNINPVLCIVFTDLYTPFPAVPPSYPVMWVSVEPEKEAPFGETIYMEAA